MATNTTPTTTKKAVTKAPAKKAATPRKAAPGKAEAPRIEAKPEAVKVESPAAKPVKAERAPKAPRITPSTDPQHQAWQAAKKDLTSVMGELLYDSRRVVPDHAKSPEEAYAKVGAALKALTEFTESIRIK